MLPIMTDQARLLTTKTQVGYRSSEQISREDALICYIEFRKQLQVEFRLAHIEPVFIDIRNIESLRLKDYPDDNSLRWVLAINLNQADCRNVMLQFPARELRDAWASGLHALVEASQSSALTMGGSSSSRVGEVASQMLRGGSSSSSAHKVNHADGAKATSYVNTPATHEKTITDIVFREPRSGFLVRVELTLGVHERFALEVPEGSETPERISQLVQDFVSKNGIMATEGTSLFRLIRNAVQQVVVERETEVLVEEISCQHLDVLMRDRLAASGRGDVQEIRKEAMREADRNLRVLAEEVPRRIGRCGTGAIVVSMILQRNIEKMKLINDMTAKAYEAESEVVNKVTESGW